MHTNKSLTIISVYFLGLFDRTDFDASCFQHDHQMSALKAVA